MHISISAQSGASGLEKLIRFKYCNELKWKSRFTNYRLYEKIVQIKIVQN